MLGAAVQQATFNMSSEHRPNIPIWMLGPDRQWHRIRVMVDTGNDITLINRETANSVGFVPERDGRPFRVAGISGSPTQFFMIDNVWMKVGETDPVQGRVGIGEVRENLLGREDIMNQFEITFTQGYIRFVKRHTHPGGVGQAGGWYHQNLGEMHQADKLMKAPAPGPVAPMASPFGATPAGFATYPNPYQAYRRVSSYYGLSNARRYQGYRRDY